MKYNEVVKLTNEILDQYDFSLTVRQIYYRLVSDPYNYFPNTRSSYTGFDRILVRARENEEIDPYAIVDRTREAIGGDFGYQNPTQYLQTKFKRLLDLSDYSKELWTCQHFYLEVWVEKDALSSVIQQETDPLRVLLFPSRGYSSFTGLLLAVDRFSEKKSEGIILHLADHDPSGLGMTKDLKNRFLSRMPSSA